MPRNWESGHRNTKNGRKWGWKGQKTTIIAEYWDKLNRKTSESLRMLD
jgi:hypothetical protein